MGHLNGKKLQTWKTDDRLAAADLNANFAALHAMAEEAVRVARTPDGAVVDLEMRQAALAQRIRRLEDLTAMHVRQRNEKEWAPLSHLGAVLTRVMDLQRAVEEAVDRLETAHNEIMAVHDRQHVRLSRLEQQPDAATVEEHNSLALLHADTMQTAKLALGQAIALRHEIIVLRDLAMAKDRQANRLEFAPMAYVGHLLERIKQLEERHVSLEGRLP